MGSLRDVIAKALEAKLQQRRRDGEYVFDWNEMADAVQDALRAHFAKPGAVTDEMHEAFHQRYLELVGTPPASLAVRRALSAALQKME